MIYNGFDFLTIMKINRVDGRDITPPFSLVAAKLPFAEIPIVSHKEHETRIITVKFTVEGDDLESTRSIIRNTIAPKLYAINRIDATSWKDLVFDDEPTMIWKAIVNSGVEILEERPKYSKGEISFMCHLFSYGAEVVETNISSLQKTNPGTYSALGNITFTLSTALTTNLNVTLNDTLGVISVKSGAPAGSYEIDLGNRVLRKDGVLANLYLDNELTRFEDFKVPSGAYTITADQPVALSYTYRPRYL